MVVTINNETGKTTIEQTSSTIGYCCCDKINVMVILRRITAGINFFRPLLIEYVCTVYIILLEDII